MAYITFQPSDHFNTKLWTGTGSENAITGIGFQPDWVWIKQRNTTRDHNAFDAVRGATKRIYPNAANAEETAAQVLKSFDSDGFTLGTDTSANQSSGTYVGWNWKANGAGSANTDGSINSTVSANTTSGFSIVKYVGTGSNATVGHGLNTAPTALFVKNLDAGEQWINYDVSSGPTKYYHLNMTSATSVGSTIWNDTAPTTSVFSVGTVANVNSSGVNYIAYCFSNIPGFSKVGTYNGNGNANGPFIYTGFKPAWLIIKRTNSTASWVIIDNQRSNPFNQQDRLLFPNTDAAEDGSGETYYWDFLSNGFKIRTTSGSYGNGSGDTYIYMAFAEEPLVSSNGIPATAR